MKYLFKFPTSARKTQTPMQDYNFEKCGRTDSPNIRTRALNFKILRSPPPFQFCVLHIIVFGLGQITLIGEGRS